MRIRLATLAAAIAALACATSAWAKTELRLINAFDARQSVSKLVVKPFTENIAKASGGDLTIRTSGPEVIKPFEQLQPVSRGVFDLMLTTPVYHSGTTSLGVALYAMAPDPKLFREKGVFDAVDRDYNRFNLKLLAIIYGEGATTGAYQIVLKKPLGPGGDLAGRKIRGTKTYKPFIESLGGSVVLLPGGEIYTAIEKGVVDGAAWPVTGALDFKWYEIAGYATRPTFGHSAYSLTINRDSFNKLTRSQQAVLLAESKKLEYSGMAAMDADVKRSISKLKELGMKNARFDDGKLKATLARYFDGLWAVAESHRASAMHVKKFRDIARAAGLAK